MAKAFFQYGLLSLLTWLGIFSLYADISFPEVQGSSVAVIHEKTGKILYSKNIDARIYPASMTKIATALFILRCYPEILNNFISVKQEAIACITPQAKKQSGYRSPPYWLETDGVTIQLRNKEEVSGRDLFHALLISSANDAANSLAIACSGSIPEFMHQMNDFLRELGCRDTHLNNPHGLHHPDHYTTARDLLCIMREGLKDPLFRQVIHTSNYTMAATNLNPERPLCTTNKLLISTSPYYYPPAIGGKTGSTEIAGKNLILSACKHDRSIITIVTGYSSMSKLYYDIHALCEAVFNEIPLRRYLIPPTEKYRISLGTLGKIFIPLPEGVYYDFYASEGEELYTATFIPCVKTFPIHQGDLLGHWVFRSQGEDVISQPVYSPHDIQLSFLKRIHLFTRRIICSHRTYVILGLLGLYHRKTRRNLRRPARYY
ncbi:D-alanyl-D-alanine carboxypeptidase DacF [Chlamydia avium]|uniref:D-alanyl-D-alanine carboxypeptidase family protein n=2 Tax=Chlamydia avium TaxID=1457141 RepID=W8JN73_9CHLA|nr:D-alanyl-D-alanine carboxypeptidase family protein [Chlamydia avium]AHK63719.1 D-alanyl-D-alanine carboxypeptidase family protein [Chlamydia avium 10DC88]EPP36294.1 D-alanyl-D-alanine carboxypeptidase family protein [Chlamydia psittaci 10_743_SC13]EPP38560.1 D-alanyl-D-alanine carboxypeptidase family protein [Chlamydia avium]VVT43300.1 D-alanyl-D-alanine carboxypeptidase DacF [Chlamydia avium]